MPSNLSSHDRFQPFPTCKSTGSKKHLIIIMVESIGSGILGLVIVVYLARKWWKMKRDSVDLQQKEKKWKTISFRKLDFNESEIVASLIDDNLVGNGGSGKVYRVVISETGKALAVKSIWSDGKPNQRLEKQFKAEIQTLGSISHNNIVKMFCCIAGKDSKLLVYEYFENKSLDLWLHRDKRNISSVDEDLERGSLDWPMRMRIAIGAAQGLCYMHHDCSPPIIHRDIKSSNILLDSDFNAKIADFGLAKMLATRGDPQTASAVAGTFGYIAPEYAYTSKLKANIDVYSFGVVLLELTTGREAVLRDECTSLAGWARLQYTKRSAIIDSLDPEIKGTSYLDQMVSVFRLGVVCTATSPSNRPSMKDCLHILQSCSNNFCTTARTELGGGM